MGARFICQHCGAAVKRDSKNCPQCGRPFANVLCPACGFEGAERLFAAGCPSCGYTAAPSRTTEVPKKGPLGSPQGAMTVGELPIWAYVLAVLAFAGVLGILLLQIP